ncbi:MAG: Uncharacterised protein [Polaribacter sp. SA4-10]|nr:MAG: Uncharacterised protein [Polaribacter sp. SA4-10]
MKKILLITSIFVSTISLAQQVVKLNIANALVLKTIDVSYEYYLNGDTSVGISGLYNFEQKSADFRYNEESMVTPYLRHYFTSDRTWNLFGEGFFGISSGYKKIELDGSPNSYEKYSDSALGISFGAKYISKSGFLVDVYGGIGRNLFSANSPILVPRLGVNVGWKF